MIRIVLSVLFYSLTIVATAVPTAARALPAAFAVTAAPAQKPPVIDGTLNDPAWRRAARIDLDWNFTLERPADETTEALVLVDAKYLYVAFVANQREPISATQRSNDQPLTSDDAVRVYLWPAGKDGIEYAFGSTPIGTRYSTSTENTVFSPQWQSVGRITAAGYVVTERIPLGIMRSDGRGEWRLQFDRTIHATDETLEWAHADAQHTSDSAMYAGRLLGMRRVAPAARTQPRIALYGLGELAPAEIGGSTSRTGMDVAVPITQTASLVATFHPDYSNVELDQQSISPTVFPRRLSEVRPFFTQGANYYNVLQCNDCLSFPLLYTPAIPTPRSGYAIEGTQGVISYAAFDAIGRQRNDMAQSFVWKSSDHRYSALYQRVGVDMPGMHDVAEYYQGVAGNYHNFNAYVTLGNDRGTQVTRAGAGRYNEFGFNLYAAKAGVFAAYHDVGSQYDPYDSLTAINDVKGPTLYAYREWDYGPHASVQSITPTVDFQSFRDESGKLNYADDSVDLSIATRSQWTVDMTTGSTYLRFVDSPGGLTNQNGISLTYGRNTATPSGIAYRAGHFGAGFLRSTDLRAAMRLTPLVTVSLEAYGTNQTFTSASALRAWLERASVAIQMAPGESLALGWRKIIGTQPAFFDVPAYIDATNLSFALYRRFKDAELYLAYGTPEKLSTQHDLLLKIVRYIGADKGT